MTEQVPKETKGGEGTDYEEKYVIDRPVLVKSCKKCHGPVHFKKKSSKQELLYCPACQKFKFLHHTLWIPHGSKIQFVTEKVLSDLI